MSVVKKVLSDKYFERAVNLFNTQKWKIESEEGQISEFDRFCDRLLCLDDDEQRDLFIELSYDYLRVSYGDYESLLCKSWTSFFEKHNKAYKNEDRLVICPLLSEKDFNNIKSSTMMLYMCQGLMLRRVPSFSNDQIRLCKSPDLLSSFPCDITELVLIDDFVGSGETALSCLTYINNLQTKIKNITILSLVAQTEGKQVIEDAGVDFVCAIERGKGLSDKYIDEELEQKKQVMERIEQLLKVSSEFEFGYGRSEALVSLIRTPNNTFPVYWYERGNLRAPFPRKDNIKMINETNGDKKA